MDLEDQHRFEIYGLGSEIYGAIVFACMRNGCTWQTEIDTTDDVTTLADLNQRAQEHAEVCR